MLMKSATYVDTCPTGYTTKTATYTAPLATDTIFSTRSHTITVHGSKSVSAEKVPVSTAVYPILSTPMVTETIFSTRLHTTTVHGSPSVSAEKIPVSTTTYPASGVSVKPVVASTSSVRYSSVDVKAVVGSASSATYAPIYPTSLSSVPAKPVSASPYGTAAGTGYGATYSTPYAAQFTGSAGKIGAGALSVVGTFFFVLFF
jgi:hypothetical protein